MRHQNVREGMLVSVRGHARQRYDGHDNIGQIIPAAARVIRMYTRPGYREPWIELANVAAQFRAKDLCCGACGGSGAARFNRGCPECGWSR